MRFSNFRFSDYRLPAYVAMAAVVAAGATLAIDRATAPTVKVEANGPPASSGAVRQIPITRTTAADLGDPDGKLTPVYPANPGKELPIKDTPVIHPVKPVATTTGTASAGPTASPPATTSTSATGQTASPMSAAPPAVASATPTAAGPGVAAGPGANACNVAACAATFRSFRESDCSYQPFEGPRRLCEGAPDGNAQIAAQPPVQSQPQLRPQLEPRIAAPRRSYDDALRGAERAVRRLPPPPSFYDDDTRRGIVVMEAPERRYELRRNWIDEPQD